MRGPRCQGLAELVPANNLQVLIIDPLYLCLLDGDSAGKAGNVYVMGAALAPLAQFCRKAGVTVALLHHFRKTGQVDDGEPAGLEELSMAGAAEFARWWCLLQRRSPYRHDGQHELWLRTGGSAGHAGLWGLKIDEGQFPARRWEVDIQPVADARAQAQQDRERRKAADQERRDEEHARKLWEALQRFPEGETARVLRLAAGLNPDNFGAAVRGLLHQGRVEACQVKKGGVSHDGFRGK